MESVDTTIQTDQLIAPEEVRELLKRLTESSVEAIPTNEPRSVAGLALETGLPVSRISYELKQLRRSGVSRWFIGGGVVSVFLALSYGAKLLSQPAPIMRPPPPQAVTPPPADLTSKQFAGLSPLSAVTFGPDSGPVGADTSFVPTHALPPGISIAAISDGVMWGSGDHHSTTFQGPIDDKLRDWLEQSIAELMEAAREGAASRELPVTDGTPGSIGGDKGYPTNVEILSYNGVAEAAVQIPPPGAQYDVQAKNADRRIADQLLAQLKQQLDMQRSMEESQGP